MTIISLPVESIFAHEQYLADLAREQGIAEGRAQMALEHGIPDLDLMRNNALYHATVRAVFLWLAYGSPAALLAERMRRE